MEERSSEEAWDGSKAEAGAAAGKFGGEKSSSPGLVSELLDCLGCL